MDIITKMDNVNNVRKLKVVFNAQKMTHLNVLFAIQDIIIKITNVTKTHQQYPSNISINYY